MKFIETCKFDLGGRNGRSPNIQEHGRKGWCVYVYKVCLITNPCQSPGFHMTFPGGEGGQRLMYDRDLINTGGFKTIGHDIFCDPSSFHARPFNGVSLVIY